MGNSIDHAVAAPAELESEVDSALGLQMISVRLPRKLIDDLKLIANKEGLGYQPLMRRVLMRFAEGEFRSMAYQKLVPSLSDMGRDDCEKQDVKPPARAAG